MANSGSFLGTWRLISYMNEDEEGNESYPFGKNARGMIYYDPAGYMGVNIMSEGRKNFSSGDMFEATDEEVKTALKYIAYSGRFRVLEDRVIHQIEVSFFPNWVGADQERFYSFEGNKLILSTRPMRFNGKKVVSRLVWEKME